MRNKTWNKCSQFLLTVILLNRFLIFFLETIINSNENILKMIRDWKSNLYVIPEIILTLSDKFWQSCNSALGCGAEKWGFCFDRTRMPEPVNWRTCEIKAWVSLEVGKLNQTCSIVEKNSCEVYQEIFKRNLLRFT